MKARIALFIVAGALFLLASASLSQSNSAPNPALAASCERKLQRLQNNAAQAHPEPLSTDFTEQEINAYFASGKVALPSGVQSVTFQGQPGIVIGTSRVDFDQLKSGKNSYNPLLSVFTGLHDVVVTAHAYGAGGEGFVKVDSVFLDGVEVPRFALEMFAQKYLSPKYPNIGLDSRFALPAHVDTATVGLHKVTITQK